MRVGVCGICETTSQSTQPSGTKSTQSSQELARIFSWVLMIEQASLARGSGSVAHLGRASLMACFARDAWHRVRHIWICCWRFVNSFMLLPQHKPLHLGHAYHLLSISRLQHPPWLRPALLSHLSAPIQGDPHQKPQLQLPEAQGNDLGSPCFMTALLFTSAHELLFLRLSPVGHCFPVPQREQGPCVEYSPGYLR